MNVFTELIKWVQDKNIPFWEQYALDLIIAGEEIGESKIEEMVVLLLEDGGVIKKEAKRPDLLALHAAAETTSGATSAKLFLTGVSNAANINALASEQRLDFGKQMTLIYGANGAGKSGYSRLLANACFSRGDRNILPNITQQDVEESTQTAVFHIERDGQIQDVPFTVGEDLQDLKSFYVHDTKSITKQLTEQNAFSFSPFGLTYLGDLADTSDSVSTELQSRIDGWSNYKDFTAQFEGKSEIRDQLTNISAATDIAALRKLALVSNDDLRKKKQLELDIAKLRARSIPEELKKKSKQVEDLNSAIKKLMVLVNETGGGVARAIENTINDLKTHREQAKKISLEQFATSMFSQVGSEQWQSFIASAHELSKSEREDGGYPHDGDHCLLCRQKLGSSAIDLIQKYWKFLEDDSRQKIRTLESTIADRKQALQETRTDFFTEASVPFRIIEKEDPDLLQKVKSFISVASTRKKQLVEIISSSKHAILIPPRNAPIPELRNLIESFETKIDELKKADPTKEIEGLEGQLRLIKHREKLGQLIAPITTYIGDLKKAVKARALSPNTKHISVLQGRLFDLLVTDEYVRRFSENLEQLGRPLPVKIRTKNAKGTSFKEICVSTGNYKPIEVLSDGEKRVASLADFLTEVALDPNSAGIALDDPVTSLDIEWKEDVARRLVKESEMRQTIIFTHDLHFVYLAKHFAEEFKTDLQCHWIKRDDFNDQPGHVFLNNSPASEKDYKTSSLAESHLACAKKAEPQFQESHLKNGFSALRTSYEALVMYELFGGVVERFQERTRVDLLDGVYLDKAVFDRVKEKHGLLSRYMEGHLHSDNFAGKKVTPEVLKREIDEFNNLKKQVKASKKQTSS